MWEQSLVVIRERRFGDVLDLALHVFRDNALAILGWGVVGVLPFALLNYYLFSGRTSQPFFDEGDAFLYIIFYFWLVSWQAPLATAGVTLLLGQRMFRQRVQHVQVGKQWLGSLPQLLVIQGLVRGVMHLFCISFFIPYILFPYMNEVILLERNPLLARGKMNTLRRSGQLHHANLGELLLRWVLALGVGLVLCFSLTLALGTLTALLQAKVPPLSWWIVGFFPAAAWITVVFMTVVRFLSYLDLRIRREGWEIELQLKTEAARLARTEWVNP